MNRFLLEVKNLKTYIFTRRGVIKAVDGVSFALNEGETLGLVGESGCGKSMTCLSLLRLIPQPGGRIVEGEIILDGENLLKKSEKEMQQIRGKKISMILQDPMTSLNPVFSVGDQIIEALKIGQRLPKRDLRDKAMEMLKLLDIASPSERLNNFPHQLSGGMRQRVVGAIALACQPRLLIADEPTTSLDVTVQAQYLNLLKKIQQHSELALIFVTHDFGIVARVCSQVAVMYAGKIVEMSSVKELFDNPLHPYTSVLMRSVPKVDGKIEKLVSIPGQPPPLHQLPYGCSFAPRCISQEERCMSLPPQVTVKEGHWVNCWKYADRNYESSS